jgi:hypothetical protein
VALNWTITNAIENTIPVSAIMPEATAEQIACADATLMVDTNSGSQWCSKRGKMMPTTKAPAA